MPVELLASLRVCHHPSLLIFSHITHSKLLNQMESNQTGMIFWKRLFQRGASKGLKGGNLVNQEPTVVMLQYFLPSFCYIN